MSLNYFLIKATINRESEEANYALFKNSTIAGHWILADENDCENRNVQHGHESGRIIQD